jgi:hypothetical protein
MSNYTVFPNADKVQVGGGSITATSTKVNGGTAAGLGTSVATGSVITALVDFGNAIALYGSQVIQSKDLFGAFHGSYVALTSVANNSGKARYTLNSHGLSVGDVINVENSTNGNVDGVQKVTNVVNANSFDTDMDFPGATASAGLFAQVAGRFAAMTVGEYVMKAYRTNVAGNQIQLTGYGKMGPTHSIHFLKHMYTRLVATAIRAGNWNIYSGTFSSAPAVQDDISDFGTDGAATPTYAEPGQLVFKTSGNPSEDGFEVTVYSPKTG